MDVDNFYGTETVKIIPEHLVTYKLLGEPGGPHYAHYDLVGGLLVCIIIPFLFIFQTQIFFCTSKDVIMQSNGKAISSWILFMQAEDQVFPCVIEFLTCHDMS